MPRVSILTPVHADDAEKVTWLAEAIRSVQAQTVTDWEMIIVDDFSPVTLDGLRSEFWEEERLRWFKTTAQSLPPACRNTAAALAESEALVALDADDQFPDENSLAAMLEAWEADKTRVVYGNLQRLTKRNGEYVRGKLFEMASYTFDRILDLRGIIPVTALHSKECHLAAGGWKREFVHGLEDVEYWIAAGKAGFCGHKVDATTLLYRRHDTSRAYKMRRVDKKESEMRNLIRVMHEDVFEGRRPMGCCGGSSRSVSSPARSTGQTRVTTLDQFSEGEKVWVRYQGKAQASFGVIGSHTKLRYRVEGPGHVFQVHAHDAPKFRRLGRGQHFVVGVMPPPELAGETPEPRPEPEAYRGPAPEMAQIERLDRVAVEGGMTPTEPSLEALKLGALRVSLEEAGWTVAKLAGAEIGELTKVKGVGPVRAAGIVNRAKEALGVE